MTFVITGLPRSRTAWFAALFNALGHPCAHEAIKGANSLRILEDKLKHTGNSDSGIVLLKKQFSVPTVIIHRPLADVLSSLQDTGSRQADLLNKMSIESNKLVGLHVEYKDIDTKIQSIIKHCTGAYGNANVVELFSTLNVQRTNHVYQITDWAISLVKEF